jgi:hypothetical protein
MQTPHRSKPSLAPWLIVAAVVLAMVLVMLYRHRAQSGDTAQAPPEPSTIAAPPVQPRATAPRIPAGRAAAQAVAERRAVLARKRQEVQARVDRTQAAFANRYQNEAVDAGWANAKEAELTRLATSDTIRQAGVEVRNLSVDCRSSMCRITGEFDSIGDGDDWFMLYMNNVAAQVPAASYKHIRNPDGTVTINAYAIGRR